MKSVEEMKRRIHILQERDPVRNANIIKKIKRNIKTAEQNK